MGKNEITDAANDWLRSHAFEGEEHNPDNPFFNLDGELYLKYDSIRIGNRTIIKDSMEKNTNYVEVGYYWKGVKVCIFPVPDVMLEFMNHPNASNKLTLTGISGAIKMVLL